MGRLARAKYVGARTWFALALVLGGCFLVGTIVYAIGVWNLATLRVEQWLLWRPETRVDCVLDEWRNLGAVPSSIILTCLLGIACVLCGYRRRVLPLLLLLLLLESGVEVVGKQLIALPLPATLRSGMTDLECPQMQDRPQLTKVAVAFGFVNQIASPSQGRISWSHTVSAMPLDTHTSERAHSYPGGHAARWGFVWWLFAWLAWRHLRARPWRQVVTVLLCLFALVGGFLQFYIGVHMLSDTLAGYLLGGALACCGIGILRRCEAKIT